MAWDGLAGDGIQAWHRLAIHPWVHHGALHAAGGTSMRCCIEHGIELEEYAADGDDRAALGAGRLHIALGRLSEYGCQRKRAKASSEWREIARRIDLSYRAYRAR